MNPGLTDVGRVVASKSPPDRSKRDVADQHDGQRGADLDGDADRGEDADPDHEQREGEDAQLGAADRHVVVESRVWFTSTLASPTSTLWSMSSVSSSVGANSVGSSRGRCRSSSAIGTPSAAVVNNPAALSAPASDAGRAGPPKPDRRSALPDGRSADSEYCTCFPVRPHAVVRSMPK